MRRTDRSQKKTTAPKEVLTEDEKPEKDAETLREEETLRDLLLKYRSLPDNAHQIVDRIFALVSNSFFRVSYQSAHGIKHFFLNRHSKRMLRDFLFNRDDLDETVSDYMKDYVMGEVYDLTVDKHMQKKESEGSFFPYVNFSDLDLTRYQIYRKDDERDDAHCLLFALMACGVDVSTIHNFVTGNYIKMQTLKKIALKLGIVIRLHVLNDSGKKHVNRYPKACRSKKEGGEVTVNIALYANHYFVFESIEKTNSLSLVYKMDKEGLFEPCTWTEKTERIKGVDLTKCMGEQRPATLKPKKEHENVSISFADTECITDPHHKAFLYARYYSYKGETNYRVYQETGKWRGLKSFLNSFGAPRNIIYFHNLKYDWFVLRKCPYIHVQSVLVKEGSYYKILFVYNKRLFEFRDSYKLIPKKLADFPRAFGLEGLEKKQFILYDLYTKENAFDSEIDYVFFEAYDGQDYEQCYSIKNETYTKCNSPVKDSIIIDGRIVVPREVMKYYGKYFTADGRYYHIPHCRLYINSDCRILKLGIEAFRKSALELINVDCFNELTLPSMANRRIFNGGHYDGVYAVEDNLRKFISQAVRGGGVCSRDNAMWHVKGRIIPIDAKAMYPSAIRRICREGGFPTGPARVFDEFDPSVYHYVVKVRILSVGKPQQIPFISYLSSEGERVNTNSPPSEPVVVDKITLDDWVRFCDITYEFIEGVYWNGMSLSSHPEGEHWNENGNPSMAEFIEEVYEKRKEYIAEDNSSMGEVCKLLMNSVYGKTITKAKKTKTVVRDIDRADDYIEENFEQLVSMETCGSQVIFEVTDHGLGHENLCHVGGMILSMAKRINYEVINLAGDLGIYILYHDTDSLHVVDQLDSRLEYTDQLQRLADAYEERYGKKLLGNNLEQFANDLKWIDHHDVHSRECIILGKKVYIHKVEGTTSGGMKETFDLPRIAGINNAALSEYDDKWDLYERMYRGEEIAFDLTYGDGVSFNFREVITTRESFIRKLHYEGIKKELY